MRTWIDENTGREIRQLTDHPEGITVGYYNKPRRVGSRWVFATQGREERILLDPETGETRRSPIQTGFVHLRESDGRLWYQQDEREIWCIDLPDGEPVYVARLPEDLEGTPFGMTCDGGTVIRALRVDPTGMDTDFPSTCDAEFFWKTATRPRSGKLWSYHLESGERRLLVSVDGYIPGGARTSPIDPTLILFNYDAPPNRGQFVWAVRTDHGDPWKVRSQAPGEMVMHPFWWADGSRIAYKYQDRRQDNTLEQTPYAEYSPCPTHFCLADVDGTEVYRSDPINHWHSHIFVSADGRWLCGEGTHDHLAVYVARFDAESTDVDFVPFATTHTPYRAMIGQEIEAGFSADGRWLIYNDTIGGTRQVCAVAVENR
jgi:hypothetical protein